MNKPKMAPVKRRKKEKPKPTGLIKPKKLYPEMEFDPHQTKIPVANSGLVLMAYLAFKQPKKRKMQYFIPKDRAAWLEFQVNLVKKRAHIIYLTEKEIRKVILRSRASIGRKRLDPVVDKDLPPCFDWTQEQVAQWISDIGFPQFKEAFLLNNITGKRLINCDASALNKMGIRYFDDIKAVAEKIRELLEIHRPNMLRALMRKVPFELYLKQRRFNGRTYDLVDFQKFCEANDFPYEAVEKNKCAEIECICEVWFQQAGAIFDRSSDSEEEGSLESIFFAPSVEFTVRHIIVRNQVVHEIIENLIKVTFTTSDKQTEAAEAARQMQAILSEGMEELGLDEEAYRERLEFAHGVAEEMVRECKRTAEVMKDLAEFKRYLDLGAEVTQDDILELRNISEDFLNEATALAVLLATGQLDLGHIFRQGPELKNFADEIADQAEARTNALVKPTQRFLDEIICEAKLKILTQEFPELDLGSVLAVQKVACRFIDKMFCGECDPRDIDSCVVDVYPEDFIDTSFDKEIGAIFSTLEIPPKNKPEKSSRPLSKSNNFGYGPPKRPPPPPPAPQSPLPERSARKSEEEDYESAGALADDEQTGDDNPLSRLESAISAVADLKKITRRSYGSSGSGEGSGTPHSSGEGSSDGQKKLSLNGSLAGEDGSSDQRVAHAHVIFDSTSSGTGTGTTTGGRRLRKKRGEHTLAKNTDPQSTSEDKSGTAKDIWEEIEALKVPDQAEKSEVDLNAKTPKHSHRKLSVHDSQALLKEKLRRADFAQRWAEQADPMASSVGSKRRIGTAASARDAERNARLVRMMADQIVSDAIQMALTHLLLQAESGQDSNGILAALKHIQIRDGTEADTVDEDETWTPQLPSTTQNSLPKLTGKDPRGTLPTGLWGWPNDKLPPAPDVRSHLRCRPPPQQQVESQQSGGQGQGQSNDPHRRQTQHDDVCETSDAVCFYPIFQNWRVN